MQRTVMGVLLVAAIGWVVISFDRDLGDRAESARQLFQAVGLDVRGIWGAESYELATGAVHDVRGRIVFGEQEWQVLYFVLDADGEARRGSGEGGTYVVRGDTVIFTHLFHLSAGDSLAGLPASALRMQALEEGAEEPTRAAVAAGLLTLLFPSGNRMTFQRIEP